MMYHFQIKFATSRKGKNNRNLNENENKKRDLQFRLSKKKKKKNGVITECANELQYFETQLLQPLTHLLLETTL